LINSLITFDPGSAGPAILDFRHQIGHILCVVVTAGAVKTDLPSSAIPLHYVIGLGHQGLTSCARPSLRIGVSGVGITSSGLCEQISLTHCWCWQAKSWSTDQGIDHSGYGRQGVGWHSSCIYRKQQESVIGGIKGHGAGDVRAIGLFQGHIADAWTQGTVHADHALPQYIAGRRISGRQAGVGLIHDLLLSQSLQFVVDQQDLVAIRCESLPGAQQQVAVGQGVDKITLCVIHTGYDALDHTQFLDLGWRSDLHGQAKSQRGHVYGIVCIDWYGPAAPSAVFEVQHSQAGPVYVVVSALYFQSWIEQGQDLFQQLHFLIGVASPDVQIDGHFKWHRHGTLYGECIALGGFIGVGGLIIGPLSDLYVVDKIRLLHSGAIIFQIRNVKGHQGC